jgi:multidrug resistance protein, MATE family
VVSPSAGSAIASGAPVGVPGRDELRHVFSLTLPILGGQMSTALTGLVDMAMIGHLGAGVVAAVGFGGLVFWVTVSLIIGVEAATQTLTARRKGEGRSSATGPILSEALRLSLVIGIPLGAVLALLAPTILAQLHDDPTVRDLGADYLVARSLGLPLVMGVAAFRGFYNGTSRPRSHLRVALVILVAQVLLNWILIFGPLGLPRLGVLGAGISATIASGIGFAVFVGLARGDHAHGMFQFAPGEEPRVLLRRAILRLGLPSGVQWALSWIAMLVFLFFAGLVGVVEAGASYLLIQVASVLSLAANSFGFAAASLVSQSLGKQEPERAYRWGWVSGCLAAGLLGTAGLGLAVFRDPLLAALSTDAQLIAAARPALMACGLVASMDAFGIVMNFSLIGAGAVRRVMAWNLAGMWLLCLPVAWALGVRGHAGMLGLWGALLGTRLVVAFVMSFTFHKRRWASLRLLASEKFGTSGMEHT